MSVEFKDILSYLRKSRGYTQNELAKALHLSTSTIGMYESGKRYPTREVEEEIADFFNVNLSTLRGKEEIDEKYSAESAHLLMAINNDSELKEFITLFMQLKDEQRHSIITLCKSMLPNR